MEEAHEFAAALLRRRVHEPRTPITEAKFVQRHEGVPPRPATRESSPVERAATRAKAKPRKNFQGAHIAQRARSVGKACTPVAAVEGKALAYEIDGRRIVILGGAYQVVARNFGASVQVGYDSVGRAMSAHAVKGVAEPVSAGTASQNMGMIAHHKAPVGAARLAKRDVVEKVDNMLDQFGGQAQKAHATMIHLVVHGSNRWV